MYVYMSSKIINNQSFKINEILIIIRAKHCKVCSMYRSLYMCTCMCKSSNHLSVHGLSFACIFSCIFMNFFGGMRELVTPLLCLRGF